jgi:probable F420-dependent oxidoreductase
MPTLTPELGTIGVWSAQLRSRNRDRVREIASTLDGLGYGTLWVPGGAGGDLFGDVDAVLDATTRAVVATGVLNIWMHPAEGTAAWYSAASQRHPGRVLLGLGSSHAQLVETTGQTYRRPLSALRNYLSDLDAAATPVPDSRRILAALGPKMLELAAERSIGAHTYFVDPVHTQVARVAMGPSAVLAPELKVVFESDARQARAIARLHLESYLQLPNYTRNLLKTGYSEEDLSGGGSDRLIDGVVAWGTTDTIAKRAQEHVDAGADHVCIQVLTADRRDVPWEAWRELAPALSEVTPRATPTFQ